MTWFGWLLAAIEFAAMFVRIGKAMKVDNSDAAAATILSTTLVLLGIFLVGTGHL